MLKSIELNSHIRNRLAEYLKGRGMDFQTAMQEEKGNKEIAAIVHSGLPTLVRKLYSEQKMQKFFVRFRFFFSFRVISKPSFPRRRESRSLNFGFFR